MVTPDDIKGWITEKLPCDYIELDGDGQHFNAIIVSPSFSGKNMIQQHRLVYDALGTRMHAEIHALSMKTYAPEEWAKR
ncbi:MAG: BolA family transcriptional regulator [Hydrogenophilales bacterium RIFOXYD1_FULL_62_11]|nr:MAG: BolA family transcriptional regulator [Hydrogenophilales bacterium RIFOXYD1_FULL_62_11]